MVKPCQFLSTHLVRFCRQVHRLHYLWLPKLLCGHALMACLGSVHGHGEAFDELRRPRGKRRGKRGAFHDAQARGHGRRDPRATQILAQVLRRAAGALHATRQKSPCFDVWCILILCFGCFFQNKFWLFNWGKKKLVHSRVLLKKCWVAKDLILCWGHSFVSMFGVLNIYGRINKYCTACVTTVLVDANSFSPCQEGIEFFSLLDRIWRSVDANLTVLLGVKGVTWWSVFL